VVAEGGVAAVVVVEELEVVEVEAVAEVEVVVVAEVVAGVVHH
jgi:hypothetical protein